MKQREPLPVQMELMPLQISVGATMRTTWFLPTSIGVVSDIGGYRMRRDGNDHTIFDPA